MEIKGFPAGLFEHGALVTLGSHERGRGSERSEHETKDGSALFCRYNGTVQVSCNRNTPWGDLKDDLDLRQSDAGCGTWLRDAQGRGSLLLEFCRERFDGHVYDEDPDPHLQVQDPDPHDEDPDPCRIHGYWSELLPFRDCMQHEPAFSMFFEVKNPLEEQEPPTLVVAVSSRQGSGAETRIEEAYPSMELTLPSCHGCYADHYRLGIPGGADPMRIVSIKFMSNEVAQQNPLAGQRNAMTMVLELNVEIDGGDYQQRKAGEDSFGVLELSGLKVTAEAQAANLAELEWVQERYLKGTSSVADKVWEELEFSGEPPYLYFGPSAFSPETGNMYALISSEVWDWDTWDYLHGCFIRRFKKREQELESTWWREEDVDIGVTIAGVSDDVGWADGDGDNARFTCFNMHAMPTASITAVHVDGQDVLYVAESCNNRVARVDVGDSAASTQVRTVVGRQGWDGGGYPDPYHWPCSYMGGWSSTFQRQGGYFRTDDIDGTGEWASMDQPRALAAIYADSGAVGAVIGTEHSVRRLDFNSTEVTTYGDRYFANVRAVSFARDAKMIFVLSGYEYDAEWELYTRNEENAASSWTLVRTPSWEEKLVLGMDAYGMASMSAFRDGKQIVLGSELDYRDWSFHVFLLDASSGSMVDITKGALEDDHPPPLKDLDFWTPWPDIAAKDPPGTVRLAITDQHNVFVIKAVVASARLFDSDVVPIRAWDDAGEQLNLFCLSEFVMRARANDGTQHQDFEWKEPVPGGFKRGDDADNPDFALYDVGNPDDDSGSRLLFWLCNGTALPAYKKITVGWNVSNPVIEQEPAPLHVSAFYFTAREDSTERETLIEGTEAHYSNHKIHGVSDGALPLKLVIPRFTTRRMGQTSPFASMENTLHLTLESNVDIRAGSVITLSGLVARQWTVDTIAGTGSAGTQDGAGLESTFSEVADVVVSPGWQTAYLPQKNPGIIRTLLRSGSVWESATLDLTYSDPNDSGQLAAPLAVALLNENILLIGEFGCISMVNLGTNVNTVLVGTRGEFGYMDGIGAAARLGHVVGLAVHPNGDLVAFTDGQRVVRLLSVESKSVRLLAGGHNRRGTTDDTDPFKARFSEPLGEFMTPKILCPFWFCCPVLIQNRTDRSGVASRGLSRPRSNTSALAHESQMGMRV